MTLLITDKSNTSTIRSEADHGKLKRLIKPTLGFKSMKTAYATLKGLKPCECFEKGNSQSGHKEKVS